jgi:hypothetical protein
LRAVGFAVIFGLDKEADTRLVRALITEYAPVTDDMLLDY